MIKAMIMVGEILHHKKSRLGHGRWIPWVKQHLEFSYKTATNYIRLFENRHAILTQEPGSLQDALAILSDSKRLTRGLLSGDYKVLRRNIVQPIIVVRERLKHMPRDPIHYETLGLVIQELRDALQDLSNELS